MITTMLIKLDKGVKERAQKVAKELGLPMSTIVSNYLKDFAVTKEVTFKPLTPTAKTARALIQARKNIAAGKVHGPFTTMEEIKKYLNS